MSEEIRGSRQGLSESEGLVRVVRNERVHSGLEEIRRPCQVRERESEGAVRI